MDAPLSERTYDLPLIQLISDPEVAAVALKAPRPAILAALRAPDSASGLARRLELPRQRLNHHLRELEAVGLVRLVEERRRRRACTERIPAATAHSFLLSPDLLGELGDLAPEDLLGLDRYGWPSLAARTLRDLAVLREEHGDKVAALSVPRDGRKLGAQASRLLFPSAKPLGGRDARAPSKGAPSGRRGRRMTIGDVSCSKPRQLERRRSPRDVTGRNG